VLQATVEELSNCEDDVPLLSALFFWASTALIQVSGDERGRSISILKGATDIQNSGNGVIVGGQPDEEDFRDIMKNFEAREIELVYLGINSERLGNFCLILVERIDRIARRICPHLLFSILARIGWKERRGGDWLFWLDTPRSPTVNQKHTPKSSPSRIKQLKQIWTR
jgi:hypothetical protein